MAVQAPPAADIDLAPEPRRPWLAGIADFARRRPLGAVGAAVVTVMISVGLLAPWLAPYDPLAINFGAMLAPPSADQNIPRSVSTPSQNIPSSKPLTS